MKTKEQTIEWQRLSMVADLGNCRCNVDVIITDVRDVKEIERRKKLKLFQPNKNELYSVNPDFNGVYTDL